MATLYQTVLGAKRPSTVVVDWSCSRAEAVFLMVTMKFVGTALAFAAVLETENLVMFSSKPVTLIVAEA